MAEEFQESDVIFSNNDEGKDSNVSTYLGLGVLAAQMQHNSSTMTFRNKARNKKKKKINAMLTSTSLPVKIPAQRMMMLRTYGDDNQLEEEWDDEEMVPPHVIVGRRVDGKMAFSVCTGNGRTLKGRDLSQVRNSILRMTGFLES